MSKKGKEEEQQVPIIIVKRIVKKNAHHGGAWKLAYADFVTAMMALFLILWLLSQLTQDQKDNVSEYFKRPLREAFVRNEPHDSNIPRYFEEPTRKSEPIPLALDLNNQLIDMNQTEEENATASVKTHTSGVGRERAAGQSEFAFSDPDNESQSQSQELKELEQFGQNLLTSLRNHPELNRYEEYLDIKVVNDGLKINLRSLEGQPMFSRGKNDFAPYAKNIIHWLSQKIANNPKKISIVGHTDSQPYIKPTAYSNWELSADRANSVRRYLIEYGVQGEKIIRIQGASNRSLYDKLNPHDPKNRRIEIILLTDEAAEKLLTQ